MDHSQILVRSSSEDLIQILKDNRIIDLARTCNIAKMLNSEFPNQQKHSYIILFLPKVAHKAVHKSTSRNIFLYPASRGLFDLPRFFSIPVLHHGDRVSIVFSVAGLYEQHHIR